MSRSQWPQNGMWHSIIPRCIHTPIFGVPTSKNIGDIRTRLNANSRKYVRDQGHSNPRTLCIVLQKAKQRICTNNESSNKQLTNNRSTAIEWSAVKLTCNLLIPIFILESIAVNIQTVNLLTLDRQLKITFFENVNCLHSPIGVALITELRTCVIK